MKVKDGFVVCEVAGKTMAVASGDLCKRFRGMIKLNSTGVILFKMLQAGTSEEEMINALTAEYGISADQAEKDVHTFLKPFFNAGLIDG